MRRGSIRVSRLLYADLRFNGIVPNNAIVTRAVTSNRYWREVRSEGLDQAMVDAEADAGKMLNAGRTKAA